MADWYRMRVDRARPWVSRWSIHFSRRSETVPLTAGRIPCGTSVSSSVAARSASRFPPSTLRVTYRYRPGRIAARGHPYLPSIRTSLADASSHRNSTTWPRQLWTDYGQSRIRRSSQITETASDQRREWDSNPRRLAPHGFSRAAHLSALPSLPVPVRVAVWI